MSWCWGNLTDTGISYWHGNLKWLWHVLPPPRRVAATQVHALGATWCPRDWKYQISVLYTIVLPVPPGPSKKKARSFSDGWHDSFIDSTTAFTNALCSVFKSVMLCIALFRVSDKYSSDTGTIGLFVNMFGSGRPRSEQHISLSFNTCWKCWRADCSANCGSNFWWKKSSIISSLWFSQSSNALNGSQWKQIVTKRFLSFDGMQKLVTIWTVCSQALSSDSKCLRRHASWNEFHRWLSTMRRSPKHVGPDNAAEEAWGSSVQYLWDLQNTCVTLYEMHSFGVATSCFYWI